MTRRTPLPSVSDVDISLTSLQGMVMIAAVNRMHQEIGDKADHQQSSHQIHRHRISISLGDTVIDLVLADIIDEHRTQYTGHRPGGQQAPVDGADMHGAED